MEDIVQTSNISDNVVKHNTNNVLNKETQMDKKPEKETPILTYLLESKPPIVVTLFTAFQHALMTIPSCLFFSSAVADVVCAPYNHPIRPTLFCASLFISGACTFIQVFFGVRLPILQGPSSAFLVPLVALKSNSDWACPAEFEERGNDNVTMMGVSSFVTDDNINLKLQKISGALMLSSVFEIVMGSLGLLGLVLRYVGPITISVTITLIGFSLLHLPITFGRPCFSITIGCAVLIVVFCLYCHKVKIPLPRCQKKENTEIRKRSHFPLFELLPILIGLAFMWFVSWILTIAGVFTDDKTSIKYLARTDAKIEVITNSPWISFSYPFMFGLPRMDLSLALAFIISSVASMFESVGDYYAAQKACQADQIPKHAMSRGILAEGVGVLLSGAVGVGNATTSLSQDIGLIILTKNGSRISMLVAAFMLMGISLIGKIGAILTTIPNPVLGGMTILVLATLVSVGLSNLQTVDMTNTRNLLVVGIPFVVGLVVPTALDLYPDIFDTGVVEANRIIEVVIGSPMFLGGMLALILDNTVEGTKEARGFLVSEEDDAIDKAVDDNSRGYSWCFYPKVSKVFPFLEFLPFLPPNQRAEECVNSVISSDEISELV